MPMEQKEIESLIKVSIPDAEVTITDLAGDNNHFSCLLYTSPSPRDGLLSRMPSSA